MPLSRRTYSFLGVVVFLLVSMVVVVVFGAKWLTRRSAAQASLKAAIETQYASQINRLAEVASQFRQYWPPPLELVQVV